MYAARGTLARVGLSVLAGALTTWGFAGQPWPVRVVAGWNAASSVELAWAWWIIASSRPADTRRRATTTALGHKPELALVRGASVVSLFLAIYLLRRAPDLAAETRLPAIGLSFATVVLSWILTHTIHTARYAHLHYTRDGGGLQFPGDHPPDYWDFAYFAFTIGMCFQVSDVVILDAGIRRAALAHALVSFAYDTAILALALNAVVGS